MSTIDISSFSSWTRNDFVKLRRAKPGQGQKKADLCSELWMVDSMITHLIIAYSAGNHDAQVNLKAKKLERQSLIKQILSITVEIK